MNTSTEILTNAREQVIFKFAIIFSSSIKSIRFCLLYSKNYSSSTLVLFKRQKFFRNKMLLVEHSICDSSYTVRYQTKLLIYIVCCNQVVGMPVSRRTSPKGKPGIQQVLIGWDKQRSWIFLGLSVCLIVWACIFFPLLTLE